MTTRKKTCSECGGKLINDCGHFLPCDVCSNRSARSMMTDEERTKDNRQRSERRKRFRLGDTK